MRTRKEYGNSASKEVGTKLSDIILEGSKHLTEEGRKTSLLAIFRSLGAIKEKIKDCNKI